MKVEVVKCNLKYPLYACKFISDDLLLVTGGGGEGNNGIDNKITLLSIDNNKIKKFRELKLSADSDSPTCMDFIHFSSNVQDSLPNSILLGSSDIQDDIKVDGVFLLGCNENSSKIMQSNINNSLQRFNYENQHMRFIASVDYDKDDQSPRDLNTYLKFLKISENIEFAACCTSKVPSIIRIINPITLNELYEIDTGNELRDFGFQKGKQAKILSYITKNSCELISCVTGTFITKSYHFDVNKYTPLKLKFIKEDCFFIILKNDIANKFEFHLFSITGEIKLLKVHELKNLKFKGITSVDYAYETDILAISGNDNSVNFFHLFYKQSNPHNHSAVISALTNSKMKYLKKFSDLHTFAITKIAFNDSGSRLSTVSADNSASIINIPKNFKNHKPTTKKFLSFIFNLIMLVILGVAGKFIYENGLHIIAKDALIEFNNETFQPLMKDKVIPFIKERMNRNKQNDTEYFKLKDNEYNDEYNEVTILSKDIEPTSTNPLSYSTSTKPLSYSTSSEASFTTSKLVNQDYYDQVVEGGDDEEAISYEDYLLSLNDIVSVEVTTSGYESQITSVVVTQSTGVVEEPKVVEEPEVVVDSEVVKKPKVVEEPVVEETETVVQEPKVVEEVVAEETETVVEEPEVIEVTETVVEVETVTSQPPATAKPQVQIQTVPNVEENIEEILNVTTDPVAAPTSVVERKAKIQTVPNVEENVEEILAAATEPVSTAAIEPQAIIQTVPNVEEKVEEILTAAIEPEVQIQTVPNVEEDVEAILKATTAPTSVSTTTSEPDVQVETVDNIEEKLKAQAVETPAPAVSSEPEPQVEETTVYETPVAAEYEPIVETVGELEDVPTDSYDHDRAMRIQKMLPEEVDVHLPEAVIEEMASNNQENTVETIVEEAVETVTASEHAVPKDLNEALESLYEENEHIEEELALDEL